jgi:hypothetical protein
VRNGESASQLRLENHSDVSIPKVWIVHGGNMIELGELGQGQIRDVTLQPKEGTPLRTWLQEYHETFRKASASRREMMGTSFHIDDWTSPSVAASFPSLLDMMAGDERDCIYPLGMDLAPLAERGDTLVLAWLPNRTLIPTMNKFIALRRQNGTLLRLVAPSE